MITLKRIRGNHIVTVDGEETVFSNIWDAMEFVYSAYSRKVKASL